MQLYIDYDDAKVTYVGLGENIAGFVDNGVENRVNLAMFNADGFDHSSGVLATLKFVIVAGNTNVDFNASSYVQDVSFNNIAVAYTNGSVGEVAASLLLGDVTAVAGTEVSIPLSGLKLENIGSMNLDVMYDASVLEFVRIDNVVSGNLIGNAAGGTLSLGYLNAEGLDLLDGKVADLVFNYVIGASAITFDAANADIQDVNFAPVALAFVDGSIDESSYTPPAFVNTLPDTTIEVNSTLAYQYTGTGADLVFALVSGPSGVAIDSSGSFSWTPVYGQAGVYSVVASLTDGVNTLLDTATVTVTGEETYVYEITENATDGTLDNNWYYNVSSAAGTINVVDSTGSAWGSHVIVFGDSAYTGLIHPQELALSNYTISADIYVVGPADADAPLYSGLAIRMTGSEFEYYRFIYRNSSSSNNGQLKLQGYNGSWHISAAWTPDVDFPALETGFHNFKVRVHDGEFQCFIDGQLLPGGPYVDPDPFMAQGYPGIYKYNGSYAEVMFDNFKVQATSVPEQKVVSIKEIQGEGSGSKYDGLAIKTTGIVTASNSKGFFIQDSTGAWNGIYVYNNSNPAIGDEVTLTAFVKEYYGLTELYDVVEYNVNSSGNEVPTPVVITASEFTEAYEGVLVSVLEAMVTAPDLGYGEWEITDSTGSVRVDDVFYSATVDSAAIVNVTGVGYYSYGNYKLLPRDSADVELVDLTEEVMALDHNTGNLVVSVFNNGTIGANKFDGVNYGSGIQWKGTDGLWRAGPVFGSAARGSVNGQSHHNSYSFFDLTNVASDFTAGFMTETVGSVDFDQVTEALITDGLAPNPYGVEILQKTASKSGDDVVYIAYGFINVSSSAIEDFSAGIFIDYDVTPYQSNNGGLALDEHMAYQYAGGTTEPYFGLVAINGMDGAIVTADNLDSEEALRQGVYGYITNVTATDPGTGDQRLWVGTKLENIAVGDTSWVNFAIVAGDNLHDLRANAENAFVLAKDAGITDITVGVEEENGLEIPVEYNISQNYPNPFNPSTTIKYGLPLQSHVKINVYNTLGQLVTRLVDSDITAGYHEVNFNASSLASGVYFYSIQAEAIDGSKNFQIVKKMMLVK